MDPYALLELEPGASSAEIKKAWKRLARKHHPDLNPDDPTAAARFHQLQQAYEVLRSGKGRVGPSQELDDDWLDTVDWMIEFRRRVVMEELMPRFVRAYGQGAALAWALQHAPNLEAAAEALPPGRRTWRLRRLRLPVVLVEAEGMGRMAALERDRSGTIQLTLFASGLWQRRGADEDALREMVFSVVDHGLAAAVPVALGIRVGAPTLAAARQLDRQVARNDWIMRGVWGGVVLLVAVMGWIMATS